MNLPSLFLLVLAVTTFNDYSSLAQDSVPDAITPTTQSSPAVDLDAIRPPPRPTLPGSRHPHPVRGGVFPWPHWNHPAFVRPVFDWNWLAVRTVTCTAQNSSGYKFAVTENGFVGIAYQSHMTQTEDASIDRCHAETNGDQSCALLGCTAGY